MFGTVYVKNMTPKILSADHHAKTNVSNHVRHTPFFEDGLKWDVIQKQNDLTLSRIV